MNRFQSALIAGLVCVINGVVAQAFSCPKGLAEIGDSKYEILQKCGEPTIKDQTQVSRIVEGEKAFEQTFIPVEDWLYNLGPDRFVVVLTFEKGKLVGMRNYGYGKSEKAEPDPMRTVEIGDPAVRVLFLYGPPTHKEERVENSVVSLKDGATLPKVTHVEEWTYNYGPNRFLRIYYFENGRLKKIETGDRGF